MSTASPQRKQQFLAAVKQIAAEKNLPEEVIVSAVEQAIATAYRRDYGNKNQEIEVEFRDSIENTTVYLVKEVVEEVENPDFEISLKEAKKIKANAAIGDEIRIDVTPIDYGRIAAQSAKQVIHQKLQDAEREMLYEMFKDREDEVLYATVARVEGTNVYLNVEKNTVLLPAKHQIQGENYYSGLRLAVYLDKVMQTTKGPQLMISRTSPKLVERLLTREIPEIMAGEVKIKGVARDAGNRSKVAVFSEDQSIDPIGACVGQKGMRIKVIMDELNGERIDMIQWSADPVQLIARALQPATVGAIIVVNDVEAIDEETGRRVKKRAAIFVNEDERAKAVGKRGQNIRLATELTGFELDMYNYEELEPFKEKFAEVLKAQK